MFRPGLKTTSCILLAMLFCAAKWAGPPAKTEYSPLELQASDLESLKAELSSYKSWTLVNPEPVLLDRLTSIACAAPNIPAPNPHSQKYVSVYVNEVGRAAMMSEKYPRFPQGSIIVKAKSSEATKGVPELLTIMVKRGAAFDRANGDWEYLVMDGSASRLEKPANVESCHSCHLARKGTDYVSRLYLPKAVREKLR